MYLASIRGEIARLSSAIEARSSGPMMHDIWLRACAEAIRPEDKFEIIATGDADTPSAAAVFRRTRFLFSQRLRLLGAEDLWFHGDVFYDDAEAASELADAIVRRGLPAGFGHLRADSAFLDALKTASRGKALIISSPVPGAPFLHFDDTWRAPEDKFSKQKQSDLRRRRRKLEKQGEVTTEIISPTPANADALLDELIELEASGWKGQAGTALAHDEETQAFFRRYARLASEEGIFRFSFMRLNGKAVAARMGVECDGSYWGFKSGYDEKLKDCSPGILLFLEVIRYAANADLATYEFLGAMEPWIKTWATGSHPKVRLRYYPYGFAGAATLFYDSMLAVFRRAKTRLVGRRRRLMKFPECLPEPDQQDKTAADFPNSQLYKSGGDSIF